jgi:cell division control protein 45
MYLPRNLISHLYTHLIKTHHLYSAPVLLLVSLDPDALCACRILTALLKRDYIPHKIQPVSGYGDFARAGEELVRPMRTSDGGSGGVVVCLGVGGLVDVENMLGLEADEEGSGGMGGVDVWVIDARRPWNLSNVFGTQAITAAAQEGQLVPLTPGVEKGRISEAYRPGRGGIFVFDDGDIVDELQKEGDAYCALAEMPELGEDDDEDLDQPSEDDDDHGDEADVPESDIDDEDADRIPDSAQPGQKRKSPSQEDEESESDADEGTPRKRRRSNSVRDVDCASFGCY